MADILSQDEIEALLGTTDGDDEAWEVPLISSGDDHRVIRNVEWPVIIGYHLIISRVKRAQIRSKPCQISWLDDQNRVRTKTYY